jgi:zinc transport system permease protein
MDTIMHITRIREEHDMTDQLIQAFTLPFVQRALIGGFLVAVLTSWMGVLVVLRQSSFFGDAIAHSSLMGVALGLLLGFNPVLVAAIYAVLVAFGLPYLKKRTALPIDSLLGFILPFSMGMGVIVLSIIPGYQPELISFLFGSILAVGWTDIVIVSVLSLVALIVMFVLKNKLIFASYDSEHAKISGISVGKIDIIYNILLAITIVAGIRLVGIVLVNALLVIPASIVRLFAGSLRQVFIFTPIVAISVTLVGLLISFLVDVPTGPAIAVVSGAVFLVSIIVHKL